MAFKSRSDLVGKRFLCIYASHCTDHYSDTNNNNSKITNSNQSISTTQIKQQRSSKDCTERCFNTLNRLKSIKIQDWPFKCGIIRASTHRDPKDSDLSVSVFLNFENEK